MDLRTFLTQATEAEFFFQQSVIHFSGPSYPLLFFSALMHRIKEVVSERYTLIALQQLDLEQLKAQLSVQFLGQTHLYWCGDITTLETKKLKDFLALVQDYKGPHVIGFFYEKEKIGRQRKGQCQITLPSELNKAFVVQLYSYLFPFRNQLPDSNLTALFKRSGSLDLESACLLMHYLSLLSGAHINYFIDEWLDKVLVPNRSLFMLSTYLFAQKAKPFFELWQAIEHEYPIQFWVSFWSDQLFRATCFIKLAQKNKFLEAKKIAYRLPFTFIKKDWRSFSPKTLTCAHNFLYQLDYRLKNGSSDIWLELFYQKFFLKKFSGN